MFYVKGRIAAWVVVALLGMSALATAQLPPGVADTQPNGDHPPSPHESVAKITVPDGFRVTLFAGEPDVYQPIDLTFDDRGRLWVVENFSYPDWAAKGSDRILIFEDVDNDGRFDSRTVFAENLSNITGIALGFGGIWACSTPELVFIPDRDNDDKPDGPPVVKLDGWNDLSEEVEHNVFNGIAWGPDGWMYGGHGILADSLIGKPGSREDERQRMNCGIWRYHPVREVFEVVAHGTTNPWGIDFDEMGRGFFTNSVIGHLWHLIPGARYERMFGTHFHPHAYTLIDQCADHYHWGSGRWTDSRGGKGIHNEAGGGHAHVGAMIYRGGTWPAEYNGSLFTANLHGNRLNRDVIRPKGSGFVAEHAADFLYGNSPWFRGIDLLYGPDGNVFVSDWTDLGECHDGDGTHRSSGRIYKISYGEPLPRPKTDLASRSNHELLQLADHPNAWYWRHALRLLYERSAAEVNMKLVMQKARSEFGKRDTFAARKLQMLRVLGLTGGVHRDFAERLCSDEDEHVQCWAVRYLSDTGQLDDGVLDSLMNVTRGATPRLQLEISSALRRVSIEKSDHLWPIVALLIHEMPVSDPNLTSMIWSIVEPLFKVDSRQFLYLAQVGQQHEHLCDLRRYIVRRAIAENPSDEQQLNAVLEVIRVTKTIGPIVDMLRGMREGLEGERNVPMPDGWSTLRSRLEAMRYRDKDNLLDELSIKFQDAVAIRNIRAVATNQEVSADERCAAIQVLAENRVAGTLRLLLETIDQRDVRKSVIRALSHFNEPRVAKELVARFEHLDTTEQGELIATLCSSRSHANTLLNAVAQQRIPASAIKPTHALTIFQLRDEKLRGQLKAYWGDLRTSSREKRQKIADWKAELGPKVLAQANLENGAKVFEQNCGKCHKLFGRGGDVGPELTGADRRNLDYVLENVVTPSAVVSKDFRMQSLLLHDGRVVSGALREQTQVAVVVQTAEKKVTVPRDEISSIEKSDFSLMPEGQFDVISKEAVRDLVGYLASDPE